MGKKDETFSICLADNGGLLTIGGMSPGLDRNNPTIVKYRKDLKHYNLMIDDVLVGGNALNLSAELISAGPGIVIDSGVTYTYIENKSYNLTIQLIENACTQIGCQSLIRDGPKCFRFPS